MLKSKPRNFLKVVQSTTFKKFLVVYLIENPCFGTERLLMDRGVEMFWRSLDEQDLQNGAGSNSSPYLW